MNANLSYLADCLIVEAYIKEEGLETTAQLSGLMGSIGDYLKSQFNKDHPVASILSFLGSGLLWGISPKLSILYSLAQAFGVNFTGLWESLGGVIERIVGFHKTNGEPMPANDAESIIEQGAKSALQSNLGEMDEDKVQELAQQAGLIKTQSFNDPRIKKFAKQIKTAGIFGRSRGGFMGLFLRVIVWLVKTALISLGFMGAVGAARHFFGADKPKEEEESGPNQHASFQQTSSPLLHKLPISSTAPSDIFTAHRNDMSSTWIERFDINDIDNEIMDWIISAYPQLATMKDKIEETSAFKSVVNLFQQRNSRGAGVGITTIPRPFQRKIDIIAPIVSGFLNDFEQAIR
jgi:hypothetical protein